MKPNERKELLDPEEKFTSSPAPIIPSETEDTGFNFNAHSEPASRKPSDVLFEGQPRGSVTTHPLIVGVEPYGTTAKNLRYKTPSETDLSLGNDLSIRNKPLPQFIRGASQRSGDIAQVAQYAEYLQQLIQDIQLFYTNKVNKLDCRLADEVLQKEIEARRAVFLEDKCRFLQEQADTVLGQVNGNKEMLRIATSTRSRLPLPFKAENIELSPSKENRSGSCPPGREGAESEATEDSLEHLAAKLRARELQLERLASQLDAVNTMYHKQLDEVRRQLFNVEELTEKVIELERELSRERRSKEEVLVQLKHMDRSQTYYSILSSSSVPLNLGLRLGPQGGGSQTPGNKSRANNVYSLPPIEFMAELRTSVDQLIDKCSDLSNNGASSLPLKYSSQGSEHLSPPSNIHPSGHVSMKFGDTMKTTFSTQSDMVTKTKSNSMGFDSCKSL